MLNLIGKLFGKLPQPDGGGGPKPMDKAMARLVKKYPRSRVIRADGAIVPPGKEPFWSGPWLNAHTRLELTHRRSKQ